jgi:uncharacterized protein
LTLLTELVALFQSPLRLPRARIVQLIDGIKSSRFVRVIHIDQSLDAEAWQLLSERLDKNWSLVDCLSFKVMQRRVIGSIDDGSSFSASGFGEDARVNTPLSANADRLEQSFLQLWLWR